MKTFAEKSDYDALQKQITDQQKFVVEQIDGLQKEIAALRDLIFEPDAAQRRKPKRLSLAKAQRRKGRIGQN